MFTWVGLYASVRFTVAVEKLRRIDDVPVHLQCKSLFLLRRDQFSFI